jgi:aspartyl-tRNA(Asn)/glutamyl-tRNA(Gln) amidotransferase subunit B
MILQMTISQIRNTMPELPPQTRARLISQYGLSERDIEVLMSIDSGDDVGVDGEVSGGAVRYFETVAKGQDAKTAVNWSV